MKKKRIKLAPIKGRLYFAFFVFVIFLTILGGRVYYWKTVKGAEFENRAKEQQVNRYDVMVQANRGSIVDRNNQPFAVSTIVYWILVYYLCQILMIKQEKSSKIKHLRH